jgi:hypothetical protein
VSADPRASSSTSPWRVVFPRQTGVVVGGDLPGGVNVARYPPPPQRSSAAQRSPPPPGVQSIAQDHPLLASPRVPGPRNRRAPPPTDAPKLHLGRRFNTSRLLICRLNCRYGITVIDSALPQPLALPLMSIPCRRFHLCREEEGDLTRRGRERAMSQGDTGIFASRRARQRSRAAGEG